MLKDRDIRQRIVGFVSFSFLSHLGLIAAAFLIPNVLKEMNIGSKQSETYLIDSTAPAALGESAQAEPKVQTVAPIEIKEAPELKSETAPKAEPKEIVKAELPKKVVKSANEKAEVATKKVLALPSKKVAAPKQTQPVETVDQSEIAVQQALVQSREAAPEVEPAPVVEQAQAEEQETQAPAEETAVAAPVVTEEQESTNVESATTTEEATTENESTTTATVAPAVVTEKPAPAQAAPAPAPQQVIAPIQKGGGPVAGLSPANNTTASTSATAAGTGAASGGVANGVRNADSLMEQPGNAKPVYSDDDQRNGRQGTVVFDAMVTRDGRIEGVQLRQSSGFTTLDTSAFNAFKNHRYLPGQEGLVRKKFQFVLNGEKTAPGRLRRR